MVGTNYEQELLGTGQWANPAMLGSAWWNKGKAQNRWTNMPGGATGGVDYGTQGTAAGRAPTTEDGGNGPFAPRPTQPPGPTALPLPSQADQAGRIYQNMPGWDPTKLADPTHTSVKYQFARAMQQVGMTAANARGNLQAVVDKMREFGVNNAKVVGDDKIDFGDGYGPIDVITSGGEWAWQPGGGGAGGGGPAGPGGAGGGVGVGGVGGTGNEQSNALFALLMKRAQQGLDVDPNDPIIKGQVEAYNAQGQRANRNYLAELAERQGSGANIGAETRAGAETIGQQTGAYQATLMGQELAARRVEIENALTTGANFLTAQQRLALENELERLRLAEQSWQFGQTNDRLWAFGGD